VNQQASVHLNNSNFETKSKKINVNVENFNIDFLITKQFIILEYKCSNFFSPLFDLAIVIFNFFSICLDNTNNVSYAFLSYKLDNTFSFHQHEFFSTVEELFQTHCPHYLIQCLLQVHLMHLFHFSDVANTMHFSWVLPFFCSIQLSLIHKKDLQFLFISGELLILESLSRAIVKIREKKGLKKLDFHQGCKIENSFDRK
ncbi:hypothetical protein BpHYR1_046451, partial [Brachionus plicatilis]